MLTYVFQIQRLIRHEYKDVISSSMAGKFHALDQIVGDSAYVCDTEHFAQAISENGNDVYRQEPLTFSFKKSKAIPFISFRFHFNHQSSQDPWPEYTGSKHGDEIEFIFGRPLENPNKYEVEELSLASDMMTYWLNFVKTG